MKFLETKHEKKSAVITSIIMGLLLLLIFFFGMKYQDPPEEYGIAVNFGTSDVGHGDIQPTEPVKTAPQPTSPEKVEEVVEETPDEAPTEEDIITQDSEDAPVVAPTEKKTEPVKKPVEKKKEEKKKEEKKEPTPDKSTSDALNSLLGGKKSEGTSSQGHGDDASGGDKGKPTGDIDASGYTGNGGSGGGNYNLHGRKALSKPIQKPTCNEEGIIIIAITVDASGKVIKATYQSKGSTSSDPCLTKPAIAAASKTTFSKDAKNRARQIGTIKYRFTNSE